MDSGLLPDSMRAAKLEARESALHAPAGWLLSPDGKVLPDPVFTPRPTPVVAPDRLNMPANDRQEIGARAKNRRRTLGLTRKQVGERARALLVYEIGASGIFPYYGHTPRKLAFSPDAFSPADGDPTKGSTRRQRGSRMIAESLAAFVAVIDRLIQLVDRREKLNRNTFTDFVAPAFADFEAVHKDYLESYRRYYARVADPAISINRDNPVFVEIERDALLSASLREKARLLYANEDPNLKPLVETIHDYFLQASHPVSLFDARTQRGNVPRMKLRESLDEITIQSLPDAEKRVLALEAIDRSVRNLQRGYGFVVAVYDDLKVKLLTPP
ncbi:hypothetical protein [Paraburkholderia sp. SIMBA_054]|uniref:hypothetical protein n=1 Tax=Paraburkholderia sp. SIMBA_054 TaxID=3085795 RepID=UPI00397D0B4C